MLGEPDQRLELGETEIPFDLFMEYIYSLGSSSFAYVLFSNGICSSISLFHRPGKYELFSHNCNNFSNEMAVFLTGNEIPQFILDLPNDILNS